jgi:hypothetical protein
MSEYPVDVLTALKEAATLTEDEIAVMCHALGWATPYHMRRAKKLYSMDRAQWPPWRNGWSGADARWDGLCNRRLAIAQGISGADGTLTVTGYYVSPTGIAAAEVLWNAIWSEVLRERRREKDARRKTKADNKS